MASGWGTMSAGAWGAAPQPPPEDVDSPRAPPPPPQPKQPAFGASQPASFRANPVAEPTPVSYAASGNSNVGAFGVFGAGAGAASGRAMTDAELRKKEAELNEREKRIREQEQQLGVQAAKKPNWPICYPLWRHNIAEDVPEESRRVVREAYLCWWLLLGALSYQFFCASVMLGSNAGSEKVPSWFLTIIYWICGVPGSIWLWYKRLYSAAATKGTFSFLTFFFMFFLHWAFCVFCAIGPQINAARWSFSGFIAGIDAFNVSTFSGIVYMIGGGVWSLLAVYSMWVLKDTWYFFRGKGGAKEVEQKAQTDAAVAAFAQQAPANRV